MPTHKHNSSALRGLNYKSITLDKIRANRPLRFKFEEKTNLRKSVKILTIRSIFKLSDQIFGSGSILLSRPSCRIMRPLEDARLKAQAV